MTEGTDKSFDSLLAQSLRATDGEPGADCPDADVLGAYFEHTLRPWAERARVEAHLATCTRCRDVLVNLGKIATPASERATGFLPRWIPAFGTLAAATVAAVLAIRFFPETQEARVAEAPSAVNEESSRFREAPDAAFGDRPDSPAEGAKQERRAESEEKTGREIVAAKPAPPAAQTKDLRDEETDTLASARRQKRAVVGERNLAAERRDPARASEPAALGATARKGGALQDRGRDAKAVGQAGEQAAAAATPPPLAKEAPVENERANGAVGAAGGAAAGSVAALARAPEPPRAVSVDAQAAPAFEWRLGKDGVERSDDGGKTWASVALPTDAKIVAVSSPEPPVAWAVGEKGLVLRTLDGRTWARVPAATDEDLVSIYAKSGEAATITTRSGRVFETKAPTLPTR